MPSGPIDFKNGAGILALIGAVLGLTRLCAGDPPGPSTVAPLIPHDQAAIDRATEGDREAAGRLRGDPARPTYHFLGPANWMNDPNGPIYYRGQYHLFYQHNPYGDDWGNMHWGHARSRDLVHWEHLPVALWPSKEAGEEHVFSGCAVLNGVGRPMIFYTSIARGRSASDHAEQWAAISNDKELVYWEKHPANPILTEALHGDVKVYDWRDPFVFQDGDRTYLVCGGNLNHGQGGKAVVNLYEAQDRDLTRWQYLGVLFTHPDPKVPNIECPNFFKLGDRWVLIVSPHRKVDYFIGAFDPASHTFQAERSGILDYGNDYAPNCLLDPKGRRLIWGWVNGFKKGMGWNGCLTLPRVLEIDRDGQLRQRPAAELRTLRGQRLGHLSSSPEDSTNRVAGVQGDALEIVAEFDPGTARSFGLRLCRSGDPSRADTIRCEDGQLDVAGVSVPLPAGRQGQRLKLHLYLDRSVMEVFADERTCCTRVFNDGSRLTGVDVFAAGGRVAVRSFEAWQLKSIW
jgi:beta-fructofuranosidase